MRLLPWCVVLTLALSLLPASAAPNHLSIANPLYGSWTCHGKNVRGEAVSGMIGWTYAKSGGEVLFFAHLKPKSAIGTIDEAWLPDSQTGGWMTDPRPGTGDSAIFRSDGWRGIKLVWARMAAQSTLSREFTTLPGALRFAVVTRGADAKKVGFTLSCQRRAQH